MRANKVILTTLAPIFSRVLRFLVFLSMLLALFKTGGSACLLCLLEGLGTDGCTTWGTWCCSCW